MYIQLRKRQIPVRKNKNTRLYDFASLNLKKYSQLYTMDTRTLIYNFKPDNRPITNDTYISRIEKIINADIDPEDFKKVKEYLKPFAYKTKRSYYIALTVYLKAMGKSSEFYDKCIKEMWEEIQSQDKKNEPTESERKNIVKKSEIESILKNLEDNISKFEQQNKMNMKYFRTLQSYLILNLYYLIPPMRNDYVLVDVYETLPVFTSNERNYISLQDEKLIINRYKTDKTYGQIVVKLPGKIKDLIRKIFKKREEIFPSLRGEVALLINSDLKRMSKVNLIQNLNTIFKRNVSVTMLRKSYISEKYPVEHTIEDMERDAKTMGHSVALQQSTYRKRS